MVRSSFFSASMRFIRPFFCGRNPSNKNLSHGNPLVTSAGINAVAPGRHSTSTPFSTQVRIRRNPGSEIPGVPASEISDMVCPLAIRSAICSTVRCSLNLWCDHNGTFMSKCFIKKPLVRVSSERIIADSFSTRIARRVMSSRLPMGVGTT